eukprot:7264934-Pyramimonas_sp.AAC.1
MCSDKPKRRRPLSMAEGLMESKAFCQSMANAYILPDDVPSSKSIRRRSATIASCAPCFDRKPNSDPVSLDSAPASTKRRCNKDANTFYPFARRL